MNKRFFLLSLIILMGYQAFSAYLRDIPQTLVQPDGTTLSCLATGDEYYHWLHDTNGYTIILDPASGYFVYADLENDVLVPTQLIPGKDNPTTAGLEPNLNISAEKKLALRQTRFQEPAFKSGLKSSNVGNLHNIVIFIRFADQTEFTRPLSGYEGDFNGSASVSLKKYYREVSDDQLTIETHFYPGSSSTVVSYQDAQDKSYYQPYNVTSNPNGYEGDAEARVREHTLLRDAIESVKANIESEGVDFDMDNDGYVDNIVFVVRGGTDGWSDLLWPHQWALYSYDVKIGSLSVWSYNFQLDDVMGVSVLCHEMFHSLGAPDLYRYDDNDISPVGPWDLMAYNRTPPQHMSAYMKKTYGKWYNSIPEITSAGTYTLNPLSSDPFAAYRISSPYSNEYFVVEYRKSEGLFESSLPGSGLIVSRINPSQNGNADGPPDEIYVYRPNGTNSENGNLYSAHFSSSTGRTEINDQTNPSSFLSNGDPGGLNISNVGSAGGTISFTVSFETVSFNPPKNLTGEAGVDYIDLEWETPDPGDPDLLGFKIYRHGTLIQTIDNPATLAYQDSGLDPGQYSYSVRAFYSNPDGESVDSNTVSFTIAEKKPDLAVTETEINASNVDAGAKISLTSNISNEGGLASGSSLAQIYISSETSITSGAQLIREISINTLNPGESQAIIEDLVVPIDLTTGNYFLIVIADPENTMDEIDENNNIQVVSLGVRAIYADLSIQSMTESQRSLLPGALIQLSGTWINQGTKASEACKLVVVISEDEYLDESDEPKELFNSPPLEPQESYNFSGSYQLSASLPPGDYFMIYYIDGLEQIPESNEANNDFYNRIEIIHAEDIEIFNIQFTENQVKDGNTLAYSFSMVNNGISDQEDIRVVVQLSESNELISSDLVLENLQIDRLLPDQQLILNGQLTIPAGTIEGNWFVHLTLDETSIPDDSDQENNTTFRMVYVFNETDLTIDLRTNKDEFKPGETLEAYITLSNLDTRASESSDILLLWSLDNISDVDDQLLETINNSGLEGYSESSMQFDYQIPENTRPGAYYLIAIADGLNIVLEPDEQNNYALAGFKVLDISSSNMQSNAPYWTIYPNPTAGMLNIQYYFPDRPTLLNIFDTTGRKVLSKRLLMEDVAGYQLDLSNFENGFYVIQLINENRVLTKKISISK